MSRELDSYERRASNALVRRMLMTACGYLILNVGWNFVLALPIVGFVVAFANICRAGRTEVPVVPLAARQRMAGITVGSAIALVLTASLGRAMQTAVFMRSFSDTFDLWLARLISPANWRENWLFLLVVVAATGYALYRLYSPSQSDVESQHQKDRERAHRGVFDRAAVAAASQALAEAEAERARPQESNQTGSQATEKSDSGWPASGAQRTHRGIQTAIENDPAGQPAPSAAPFELPSYAPRDVAPGDLPGFGEAPARPVDPSRAAELVSAPSEPPVGQGYGGAIAADVDVSAPAAFDESGRLLPPSTGQTFDPTGGSRRDGLGG